MKRLALFTLALAGCSGSGAALPPHNTITINPSGPATSSATIPYALLNGETLLTVTDSAPTQRIAITVQTVPTASSGCVSVLPADTVPANGQVYVFATNKAGCAYPYTTEVTFSDSNGASVNDFLAVSYDSHALSLPRQMESSGT